MLPVIQEWLNLALRWAHVIAAIMWIGDSFLFMWMDRHLEAPLKKREGDVAGELWLTHSGGFYEIVKRRSLRPTELPPKLYWFKWESYSTWITGFFLITVVYYLGDQVVLVAPQSGLGHAEGVAISVTLLGVAVLAYDFVCRTPLVNHTRLFGVFWLLVAMAATWALSYVFTPRAVFLQIGAMAATVMSSNVLLRIIPAQRHMLAATSAGTPVDTSYGKRAKLRSTHNHYATLPVLVLMLSNHFPSVYGNERPWLTLGLLSLVGVGVKAFMNQRQQMHPVPLIGTVAALCAVIFVTLPPSLSVTGDAYANVAKVPYDTVHQIVQTRCVTCHSVKPTSAAFPAPPLGITLDTADEVKRLRDRIQVRTVDTHTMPLGNITGMTDDERALVGAWIHQGADITTVGGALPRPAADAGVAVRPASPDAGAVANATANPLSLAGAQTGGMMNAGADAGLGAKKTPAAEAAETFAVRCAMCHGPKGNGDGPASAAYNPRPRKFSDPSWQKSVSDEQIRKTIVAGGGAVGKSPLMPGQPDLEKKPELLDALVKFIRDLEQ